MNKFTSIYLIFIASFFVGCGSSLETTIEFKGRVYYGYDAGESKIGVLGPLNNAKVIAIGHPEFATTGNNNKGEYTLTIKTSRKFNNVNGDQYILEASGTAFPSIYPQGNYVSEQITVYGKPGDTIQVRDFIVFKHKIEDTTNTGNSQ